MYFSLSDLVNKVLDERWHGFIGFSDSRDGVNTRLLKKEIYSRINSIKELKIQQGEVVIVESVYSTHSISTLLACWHLGITVIPVKFNALSEVEKIAIDSGARIFLGEVGDCWLGIPSPYTPLFKTSKPYPVTSVDLAMIIYSSGSTGHPKGICLTHGNVLQALSSLTFYLDLKENDKIMCVSPMSFDYGLYQLLFSLYCDLDIIFYRDHLHPVTFIKKLKEFDITCLPIVPVISNILISGLKLTKSELPSLKKITNTGGRLGVSEIQSILKFLPDIDIYCMYGLTETKRVLYLHPKDLIRKMGSVGLPIPGLVAKLFRKVENNGQCIYEEVENGQVGELFVRSGMVMQGYKSQSNTGCGLINGKYRDDNWLSTGDLFKQDSDGYFYFVGRSKELIKQAGFCLYPNEIEDIVGLIPEIEMCVVIPDEDRNGNEIAHIAIKSDFDKELILLKLNEVLDVDYRPKKVTFLADFIFTQNGKIDRNGMKEAIVNG